MVACWAAAVWVLLAPATVGAVSASAPAPSGRPSLRFAPEIDYAPFVFRAADGSIQGLSVDVLQRVAERAQLEVITLPAAPLAANLAAARRGEADVLTSLRPTAERSAYLDFSAPYVRVPAVVVTRRAEAETGLAQLAGRPVAVGQGYAVEGHVRQRYPAVQWVAVSDDREALDRLRRGSVVAVVADVASVAYLRQQAGADDLVVGEPVGFDYTLSLAWRKDRPDLGEALERGLRGLTASERDLLLQRWLNPTSGAVGGGGRLDALRRIGSWIGMLALLGGMGIWWWVRRTPRADESA